MQLLHAYFQAVFIALVPPSFHPLCRALDCHISLCCFYAIKAASALSRASSQPTLTLKPIIGIVVSTLNSGNNLPCNHHHFHRRFSVTSDLSTKSPYSHTRSQIKPTNTMDFDIPTDLISKSQIGFREAAGLSLFDRNNTSLPPFSTVEASILSLDPSPSYLRCKFCQGKLLRGSQSLICVYCGQNQKKDLHPEPISFNSTHGYSWLLQSLNFNGSERIGSLAEGSGTDGGQGLAEDELTLSELLDLKISWRDEPEKLENSSKIKTSEHNISLNLGTTDFDEFFTKSMSKSASVSDVLEEQPIVGKADQNKIVEGEESFTSDWNAEFQFADTKMEHEKPGPVDQFFPKSVSTSAVVSDGLEDQPGASKADRSKIFEGEESFTSDWNAEFQFADTKMEHEKPGPGDQFFPKSMSTSAVVSDVLEDQPGASKADQNKIFEGEESFTSDWNSEFQFADTKVEHEKPESVDLFKGAETDLSSHMDVVFGQAESFDLKKPNDGSDLFQVDLFANTSSATFQQSEQLDAVVQSKDGLSGDLNDYNLKDVDGDWFSDGSWQKSSVKDTLNDGSLLVNPDDTSTDTVQAKDGLSGNINDFNLNNMDGDWFSDGNWQKSSVKSALNDGSLQDNPNDTSTDWFENANWQKDSTNNNTATVKDDILFDIKPDANDLIQSENFDVDNSGKQHSDATDWFENSQWMIGGSGSTTNNVVSKDDVDDDDGFGEWNDFTSSTGNKDPFQASWKESSHEKVDFDTSEKMSELDLFQSRVVSPEVDFGNFSQSDIFAGDKNPNDTPGVYDMFSEVSTAIRNANIEAGNNAEGTKNDASTSSKDDVQMLMSQMHDLSFMLKNELSVPSKPDDTDTSHS
ncbi:hypothetical protein QVD17_05637 [Tagetes erecta]|uniref:DUF7815 domain-containing protein n=1 Tax=Tagetes erecta TaxID=13708 RepID=A0AAD8P5P7_TARER|nr:hypothetical protein QVD17_05637 [Tagetes erecta]